MKVSEYLFEQIQKGNLDSAAGKELLKEVIPDDIAIVGISCEYSDVKDTLDFYNMNKYGKRGFKEFPKSRIQYIPKDHDYLYKGASHLNVTPKEFLDRLCDEKGAYLDDIDTFDPEFFGISSEEAKYIDPTHRLVMKHSYLALEDAGIKLDHIKDSRTAVYIGKDKSITANYRTEIEEDSNYVNSGTWEGILASRLNYIFNLSGGSFVIDTACSSSLVSAHLAVKTLRDNEIDTAIVGGIALGLFPRQGGVIDQYGDVETPRSLLKVFDAQSQGTIFGEGVGIVILKRLKDAIADNDNIYSVIRGSMINSDGKSNGLTAPNPHAQKDLILDVYERSQISPETVEYIEAHGTGTKLGDPIEFRGLTDAYRKYVDKKGFCAITSLKENIGHTVGASGVGGLIKMSLALQNKEIFPIESFESPNEYIRFVDSPFYVPTKLQKWERGKYPRRGGISSFGFSGTNAHMILEEYEKEYTEDSDHVSYPFVFSAQSAEQLAEILKKYLKNAKYIQKNRLRDISYTLIHKRNHFKARIGFFADTMEEFMDKVSQSIDVIENDTVHFDIFLSKPSVLTADLKNIMEQRLKMESEKFTLPELINLYIDGYDSALESTPYNQASTVTLPTYEFKKEVFWANVRKHNIYQNEGASLPVNLRLIKRQTLKTNKSDVYAVSLSPKDWFVDDHRIGGKRTFSGTTYTELAAELAALYLDNAAFTIEKLLFKNLIQLEESNRTFFIHVNKGSQKAVHVEVFSYENDQMDRYVTHASFTLKKADNMLDGSIDVSTHFEQYLEPAQLQSEENLFFKGRWDFRDQDFRLAIKSKNELHMALTLKDDYLNDLNEFYLHPSILDGILGAMVYERAGILAIEGSERVRSFDKNYLPLSYGAFTFTGNKFTQMMYSKTEFLYETSEDNDVISANVSIFNGRGELVAYVEKYNMKSFANAYFKPSLHTVAWEKSAAVLPEFKPENWKDQRILLISNQGIPVHEEIQVDFMDYKQLKDQETKEKYNYVIYAPWISSASTEFDDIEEEMIRYFEFSKNVNKWVKKNGKVLLAADNAFTLSPGEGSISPLSYSLLSSGRILEMENTGFSTQMIHMENLKLEEVLSLGSSDEFNGKKIYVDGSAIYEEALIELKDLEDRSVRLNEGDGVIVTGGYGGIGLEYIDEILNFSRDVHIAILGRTDMHVALTDKETLTELEEKKLKKIQELYRKGTNLHFYKCDITCEEDVKRAIAEIAEAAEIKGVVHLAGVPEDGMLFQKSKEDFLKVVSPKVTGITLLKKHLADQKLSFFVSSSTMTTIAGSAGQFSYTFANAFLEGSALNDDVSMTVQWPGWNETGMALNFGDLSAASEHLLMKPISSAVGREYIRLSLEKAQPKMIVGEFNARKAEEYLGAYINLPKEYLGDGSGGEGSHSDGMQNVQVKNYEELEIVGAGEQNEIEKFVTVTFATILGCDVIDVNKSFTELGGDSLKAFAIYSPIAEHFDVDIEVADIFVYSTITQLSDYISELQEESNG
ncbi:SDR family oxidoreductase [Actinomycetes bacterium NPDC127524]